METSCNIFRTVCSAAERELTNSKAGVEVALILPTDFE